MAAIEQFLSDGREEKYEEARKLDEIDSVNDPETDPFKSKYKAREIWSELKQDVEKRMSDDPNNQQWIFLLAVLEYRLGMNYSETEERSTGEERLTRCVDLVSGHELDEQACAILQKGWCQLGILWCARQDNHKALDFLKKSEDLYKQYKHEVGGAPLMIDEHLHVKKDDEKDELMKKREYDFEDMYTHTLYYLAQVFGKLEENRKSAEYCHVTLCRQLETMKYSPIDWVLNAATLSQYYITTSDFTMARHCLAAASVIVQEAGEPDTTLKPHPDETQEEMEKRERIPKVRADVLRCWSKYALALLEASKDKLFEEVEDLDKPTDADHNRDKQDGASNEDEEQSSAEVMGNESEKKSSLYFNVETTLFEEQITDQYIKIFEEARKVFLIAQKWINSAKEFYVLDGHCTDNVELVQDLSKLYKLLAFYDPSFERQCKMHKRRADILADVHKQLNPQFYLMICRQLIYEMAEVYSCMLDLKLAVAEESGQPMTPHAARKINLLASQSIKEYCTYLDSLLDSKGVRPSKLSNDDQRPALVAYFCVGRLYSKFIEPDIVKQLSNMRKSLEYYQYIADYCYRNPEARPVMKSELEICEEMVALLPAKMERVRATQSDF